jgi:uncharacterized protein YjbI with pentapeptide repeats
MANGKHLELLRQGVQVWNAWREHSYEGHHPDFRGADLAKANLSGADLREAHFGKANLSEANLRDANLRHAHLDGANLSGATLHRARLENAHLNSAILHSADLLSAQLHQAFLQSADLREARCVLANFSLAVLRNANFSGAHLGHCDLSSADLHKANLSGADLAHASLGYARLREANLVGASLQGASLIETDFSGADLTACRVYGISTWGIKLSDTTKQQDLLITRRDESPVTVDSIEIAQFVYLLLHNHKIRDVIDTIGKKGVLLLGRFTGGRIAVLERLREELRKRNFMPMVFNFDKPETKDFTETVRLLAALSRFVIVEITNPRSAPLELQATIPDYMIPFVPILEQGEEPFAMFRDLWIKHREWVLDPIRYPSVDRLIEVLDVEIVTPAQTRFAKLMARKAEQVRIKEI